MVLLTDGLPEEPTRDRDARRLRDDILPRLQQLGAKLYVLAFGPDIVDPANKAKDFLDSVLDTTGPAPLGRLLLDAKGEALPKDIVQIFSETFGYAAEGPKDLSSAQEFVLADTEEDKQAAAVVVFRTRQHTQVGARRASGLRAHRPTPVGSGRGRGLVLRAMAPAPGGPGEVPRRAPLRREADRDGPKASEAQSGDPPGRRRRSSSRSPATCRLEILVIPASGSGAPSGITIEYNETGEEVREGGAWKKLGPG